MYTHTLPVFHSLLHTAQSGSYNAVWFLTDSVLVIFFLAHMFKLIHLAVRYLNYCPCFCQAYCPHIGKCYTSDPYGLQQWEAIVREHESKVINSDHTELCGDSHPPSTPPAFGRAILISSVQIRCPSEQVISQWVFQCQKFISVVVHQNVSCRKNLMVSPSLFGVGEAEGLCVRDRH